MVVVSRPLFGLGLTVLVLVSTSVTDQYDGRDVIKSLILSVELKWFCYVSRSRFAGYDARRGAGRPTGGRPVTSTASSGRSAVCQWWSVRTHVSTYLM